MDMRALELHRVAEGEGDGVRLARLVAWFFLDPAHTTRRHVLELPLYLSLPLASSVDRPLTPHILRVLAAAHPCGRGTQEEGALAGSTPARLIRPPKCYHPLCGPLA